MEDAERIWTQKRGKKAEAVSLYEWLDYQSKLTKQDPSEEHVVLYNSAGTNVSAASVRRSEFALPLIAEHKVYRGTVNSAEEADYLAALLNSSVSNQAIKPFQTMGLMGERDIEKKLMDLPIPQFKADDSRHEALVRLGQQARERAGNLLKIGDLPPLHSPGGALGVRAQLKNDVAEIDRIVKKFL